jgi:predicted metalloprotease
MRWKDKRRSENVEDRRGQRAGGGGLKIGGLFGLIAVVVVMLLGGDPRQLLQMLGSGAASAPGRPASQSQQQPDEMSEFLRVVMASTEDVWTPLFRQDGQAYQPPTLVIFEQQVQSACGRQSAATGPFYCPPDRQVYLDTSFFRQLESMGGAGDFAVAYVVGHEVGHHIQNLVGVADRVRALQQGQRSQAQTNQLQVLMELQADCFAGVWGYHANRSQRLLEPGDTEEGLSAAAAIGDDVLLRRAGQRVSQESFTHGSAAQRQEWLARGLQSGNVDQCDTFAAAGVQL